MKGPAISVGVPVYNGADLLAESLECLAQQSFRDLEVVISDNASTDGSAEIAAAFAARDPRFRLIRQVKNIGPLPNFRAVAEAAHAPLFLWRAHDDLSSPDYIAHLYASLTRHPEAALAVGRCVTIRIGRPKKRLHRVPATVTRGPGADPATVLGRAAAGWFYGLWRREHVVPVLDEVIASYTHLWAWDHLMMFPAITRRQIAGDDRAVFFHRLHTVPGKAARPRPKTELRDLRAQYLAFCTRQIDQAGLDAAARTRLRLALARHVNRRVVAFTKTL